MTVKGHSPAFLGCFLLSAPLPSAVSNFTEVISDVDDPRCPVVNLNLLPAVPIALLRSMDDDFANHFVQHFRRQFFRIGVFLDIFEELLEIACFMLTIFNKRL